MTSLINADTSTGLTLTSDTSGALDIQSAGTTKIAMDSSGNVGIGTEAPACQLDIGGTDAMKFPSGTTAQRPASPTNGMTRFNSTFGFPEVYTSEGWVIFASTIGTSGNPATSGAQLKSLGRADGSYYVTINGSTRKVWVITRYAEAAYIKIVQWNNTTAMGVTTGINVDGTWTNSEISNNAGKLTTADINWIIGTGGSGNYSLMRCNGSTNTLFNTGAGTGRLYIATGHPNYGTAWDINVTHELYLDTTSNGTWDYGARYTNDTRGLCNHTTPVWHQDHNYNGTWITAAAPYSALAICHTIGDTFVGSNLHWMSGVSTSSAGFNIANSSTTAFAVYMEF